MTIRRICLPLLVALALAGCANGGTGDSAGAPAELPSSAPAATPAVPPSAAPTEESGATKPPAGGVQTLTGTITAGVEPNCLLLEDHLLIISDAKLQSTAKAGATVTVTGQAAQGMMTTCQQGTPFLVATLRAN
ncbi:hypothetical protein DMB66_42730 [Actinoplanes sp. ATCC 53533]|uniref:hypothetical protein n=1 Tax=Actinoplanes sp. ATCC 53533 TaxID=1288362 RepID=UPI000F7A6CA7|nr:hypothetical protein [Actinoplanes sp. ATCC 53533]RSM51095.1 hypothetical protein DMB66_42730 [Actinoplanes sp. ATCC 53533]